MDEALRYMERVTQIAEKKEFPVDYIVELRLDYLQRPDVKRLLYGSSLPKIATNRVKHEGGLFKGSEEERFSYLQEAVGLGVEYVDVEFDYFRLLQRGQTTKLIVSHHNQRETPANLQEIYRRMVYKKADIVKIATTANSQQDSLRMLQLIELARSEGVDIIGLCMGVEGIVTRIRGPQLGAYLTFAPLEKGKESAPGQITVDELLKAWF